jgi:hypothetical protein
MIEKSNRELVSVQEDLLIIELDDRLEMAVATTDTNYGCNGSGCKQNIYCP